MENTSNQSPLSLPEGIAIQGYEGSFHQVAAQQYFGKQVPVICCATFREVVKIAANKKESGGGMMAIENSIAGSILPNYTLLEKSGLKVTGEVYLPIKQHLLANPGVTLDQVKEVHSHHMAIQQCMEYLDKYDWKLVETDDTALSAKHVHQHRSKHIAAIASKLAAELFELEVLVPNIHTQKSNYTRFLVLQREVADEIVATANKASVNFETDHTKGSLVKALNVIADGGINLSKLQSMPIAGTNFKYSFHVDMEFETMEQFHTVIDKMGDVTQQIKIYGVYRNGNTAAG